MVDSILYYLEPSVELNDALFRYASLKSVLLPEIKSLIDAKHSLSIKIIVGQSVYNELIKDGIDFSFVDICVFDSGLLSRVVTNSYQSSMSWYQEDFDKKNALLMAKFIKKILPDDFNPDVIISYESPVPFMQVAFPKAIIMNAMFGAFSRAPFSTMMTLDPIGLFGKSYQSVFADIISSAKINHAEKELLRKFRRNVMKSLATTLPLKSYVEEIISKFDSVILLACQIDKYFAFDGCSQGVNQFEMVEHTLKNTPINIGVLVTEHGYRRQISEDQVYYLKNNYANFIYYDGKEIGGVSQYILPYIDGVVTVSSSIAYQAALWKKPLYVMGQSQINCLAYSANYKTFCSKVLRQEQSSKDAELYFILAHLNIDYRSEVFANGSKYLEIIERICESYKNSNGGFETFKYRKSLTEMEEMLIGSYRGWLLKKDAEQYKSMISPDHLRISMSECKVISFDLFDTLAERDFAEPHELFLYIEPAVRSYLNNKNFLFHYFRRQAENDTRRPTRGEFEVTLDQIYATFAELTGLSSERIEYIKNLEIEAEVALVHPKKKMIKEYNFASILMERRSVITDIYLNEEVIVRILNKIRVNNYSSLWVSAETKTRKHNGTLYPDYIDWVNKSLKMEVPTSRMLHVGDNQTADGDMAKKYGMRTYVFPKALDNFKRTKLGSEVLLPAHRLGGVSPSIMIGMFANKFYSATWNKTNPDSLFSADSYQYGYMALGPLVLGFVQWLYHRAKLHGLKHLYFLARDGWVLKKAYDQLYGDVADAPKSYYLYCSRRAVMAPSIMSEDCIYELACQSFNARSIESFLDSRYGVTWSDLDPAITKAHGYKSQDIVSPYYEQVKLHRFLKAISPVIMEKAKTERDYYIDYLNSLDFVEHAKNKDAAVVDIGYSGSMQMYLKKMLGLETLAGYYYLTHHHSRDVFRGDIFEGYLQNLDDHKVGFRHPLNDHIFIFESALSSPEGSLLSIKGLGKNRVMNFLDAEEEERRKYLVNSIHRGADDFSRDFCNRFKDYRHDYEISPLLSSAIIFKFAGQPTGKDASMFSNFEVENLFGGGSVCLVAEPPKNVKLDQTVINRLIDQSKWKPGARAYYASLVAPATPAAIAAPQQETKPSQQALVNVSRIEPPLTIAEKAKALLSLPLSNDEVSRKRAKLARSPYQFFADSSVPTLVQAKELFNEEHQVGRLMSRLIRKIV